MTVLVGVDAGGSHTEAVVSDESLTPVGRYRGPRGAVTSDTVRAVAELIAAVVRRALSEAGLDRPDTVVVGAAGAGQDETRVAFQEALSAILGPQVRVHATTDAAIALEAAFSGTAAGVVLIAGSGSIAYGRDRTGATHRVGGLGWQLGDEGSGYALGRAALVAAARDTDRGNAPSILHEHIRRAAGLSDIADLAGWAQAAQPFEVAALAVAVCAAAEAGDAVAASLVRDAARDLAGLVQAMTEQIPREPVRVALVGGLLSPSSPVRRELMELLEALDRVELVHAPVDPPKGALRIALSLSASPRV